MLELLQNAIAATSLCVSGNAPHKSNAEIAISSGHLPRHANFPICSETNPSGTAATNEKNIKMLSQSPMFETTSELMMRIAHHATRGTAMETLPTQTIAGMRKKRFEAELDPSGSWSLVAS